MSDIDQSTDPGADLRRPADRPLDLAIRDEQLRLALETGDVGFWDVDPQADTLYWPANVRAMFGIFSDRPVSMRDDFYAALHPDDRAATQASFASAMDPAVRSTYASEYRTIGREDGVVRWVSARGRGLFDPHGRCLRVIGTAVDVTARKRDEARLREANDALERRLGDFLAERKLFADIVERTDALIQVLDPNFRMLACNRASCAEFERLYGRRLRVGDDLMAMMSHVPPHQREARELWSRALAGESFTVEAEFGEQVHRRSWYELHFEPLFSTAGQLIGAFLFGYDISRRKAAQARLAEAESALQQARRMETIGLLTGGVAHDFNNVLHAIQTKFDLISHRPHDVDAMRDWAASGAELARRGARVTTQLLALSRRQTPDNQPTRLATLLNDTLDLLRTTLGPGVTLTADWEDVWVLVDPTELEMALLNLVVNAKDAMRGHGTLCITAGARDADQVDIVVSDDGPGMSPELIEKAFTAFFTTKAVGKGSGLGLAQVSAMANRAGGHARIDSDGCSGTSVILSLWRVAPAEPT